MALLLFLRPRSWLLFLALILIPAAPSLADAPHAIPFQAQLKTSGGQTVDNPAQPIVLTLYDAPTAGAAVYTEGQTVSVSKGLLATLIGNGSPAAFNALPFNVPYWVGVKVGSDAEMTPRIPLSAVPYANFAQTVAGGSVGSGSLADPLKTTVSRLTDNPAPVFQGRATTDYLPFAIAVSGKNAYVVSVQTGELQIFDVSDPTRPTLLGQVSAGDGATDVAVQGGYVYVLNFSDASLRVFDVSHPANPLQIGNKGVGGHPYGLAALENTVCITNNGLSTLQVFDVSDPTNPVQKGTVATDDGPQSVRMQGSYAYVANANANSLQIFDVSNTSSPVLKGSVATGTFPSSVSVHGHLAAVVCSGSSTLQLFDVTNPASPTLLGSAATNAAPSGVALQGALAYAVNYNASTIQVFDISNPAAPVLRGSAGTDSAPDAVAVLGPYAFVTNHEGTSLQAFLGSALTVQSNLHVASGAAFDGGIVSGGGASFSDTVSAPSASIPMMVGDVAVAGTAQVNGLRLTTGAGAGKELVSDAAGNATWQSIAFSGASAGGDLTGVYPNPAIAAGKVDNTKLASDAASLSKVSGGAMTAVGTKIGIGTSSPSAVLDVEGAFGASTEALDQQQTLSTTGLSGADLWQSFTAGVSGSLTRLDVGMALPSGPGPQPGTITFYAGEGTGGTQLAQQNVSFPSSSFAFTSYAITAPFPVTAGQKYTYRLRRATDPGSWAVGAYSSYGAGRSSFDPSFDLCFKTYVSNPALVPILTAASGGAVNVPGALTAGSAAIPQLTGSVSVTGNASTTGSVGIGTAAGTFPLTIGNNVLGDKISLWGQSGNNYGLGLQGSLLQIHTDGSNSDIAFGYGTSAAMTETMRVRGNGSVGIGTKTPATALDLNGSLTVRGSRTYLGNDGAFHWFGTDPASGDNDLSLGLKRIAANNYSMVVNGRIGIGTQSPQASADIKGSVYVDPAGFGGIPLINLAVGDTDSGLHSLGDGLLDVYSNNIPTLRVRSGYVGLGTVTSPQNRIELPNSNDAGGHGRAQAWITYSSGRWKHNVTPIEDALGKVMALNGVMFDWNRENGGGHDIGFVAEQVGKVVPELVVWEPNSPYAQGMKYDRVTALTVEAIKAQQKEIQEKDARITALEEKNAAMEARLQRLEQLMSVRSTTTR